MAYGKTSGRPGSTRMAMSGLMEENPRSAKEVGEEMLSNIGRQVLSLLQAGGDKARQFDDAYSKRVMDTIMADEGGVMAVPRGFLAASLGSPLTHGVGKSTIDKAKNPIGHRLETLYAHSMPVTSGIARYGVPAAAALGLAELTGEMYDYASEQPMV